LLLAAFPSRPGFELSIQGFSPTGDSFSRLKSRPVALSRAKKNFAYRTHRQMVELFRTKQRQKKPSRTTAFQSTPDSSAQRKAKINDCLQRSQLYAGREFNCRITCKKLHFKYILSCQQSAETRLADSCCCWRHSLPAQGLNFQFKVSVRPEILSLA